MSSEKLVGLQQIANFMGWSLSKTKRRVPEFKACGAVFEEYVGSPPKKHITTFKTILLQWYILKTQKGEHL